MNPFGLGAIPRPKDSRDFPLGAYQAPLTDLPAQFIQDVSAIPVKMQGKFGTCGAHAGAFFDSKLQTDKRTSFQDLSPKYLWKQIKLIDGFPVDAGTDMRSIFRALQNTGDCDEALLPDTLDATIQEYTDPRALTDAERYNAYQNDIGNYAFIDNPTWDQLRQAIYQNKAVLCLLGIGDGWWKPSWNEPDILPLKMGNNVGNHFVVLHSYDEKYVYFRNSWSAAWGRNGDGYFDISYLPHILEIGTAIALPAPYVFTTNLSFGTTGNAVLQLQKRLGVKQTGHFGFLTLAAVMVYQSGHNLPATGYVGPQTRQILNTTV